MGGNFVAAGFVKEFPSRRHTLCMLLPIQRGLVLRPSCSPENVGVNKK